MCVASNGGHFQGDKINFDDLFYLTITGIFGKISIKYVLKPSVKLMEI